LVLDSRASIGETELTDSLEVLTMLRRLAPAVVAVALVAGTAVAQVTDIHAPPTDLGPGAVDAPQPQPQSPTPNIQVSAVPEPGSILLVTGAATGWVIYWRRKWRAEPAGGEPKPQP
jgi:hypothetical protein